MFPEEEGYFPPREEVSTTPTVSRLDPEINLIFKVLKMALEANFQIPPEVSPLVPLIHSLVDNMLLLKDLINRQSALFPRQNLEAGLVDNEDFGGPIGKFADLSGKNWEKKLAEQPGVSFGDRSGLSNMPTKLLKIPKLTNRFINPEEIEPSILIIVEWLTQLTTTQHPLEEYLVLRNEMSEKRLKQVRHQARLRSDRLKRYRRKERAEQNNAAARWRKAHKK
jgi:hypothetical protein